MKKTLVLVLALVMLTLTACGGGAASSVPGSAGSDGSSPVSDTSADTSDERAGDTSTAPAEGESADVSTLAPVGDTSAAEEPAIQEGTGTQEPQVTQPEPQVTAPTVTDVPEESDTDPAEEPVADPAEDPVPAAEATAETAMGYIGRNVSDLIAAIGSPISSSYAPSCLGPGEDGELIYDSFTVYTYRENGVETVEDVL